VSGWFVVNAREAEWWHTELGDWCPFEREGERFPELGINLNLLRRGEPNCMYHGEGHQEDFLVLEGECVLIVDGKERSLRKWDFVHCPPWTEHVFVGTGDEPCLLLAVGSRGPDGGIRYRVDETARKYGACVERETDSGEEAYARFARPERSGAPDAF
jgi:uncharacterized cupin superfamily protein